MIGFKSVFLLFVLAMAANGQTLGGPMHGKTVVCYVATWAIYRPEAIKFSLEDLEPSLCTHIVYSFAGLDEVSNSIKSLDPYQDLEKDYGRAGYRRAVGLKDRYPHLKVTIAIGGWNEGSPKYSKMASNPESRAAFVKSVLNFLERHKFDGLDLDWEYPTKRDGMPYDKANFVSLVKELKEAFEPHGYILTAALGAGKNTMDSAYDLATLSRYLNFIHIMSYDYHGTWDGVFGANAPLKSVEPDVLSVEYTVKYMLAHGVSPYKMILGLPMYGRTFILQDSTVKDIQFGVTAVQPKGFKGPYTGEDGFMGYNEICMETTNKSSQWMKYWHEPSSTPYLRRGAQIISYDDTRSIANKVRLAIEYGLGGLMVWSVDTDEFKGVCESDSDPYVEFVERYRSLVDDPVLNKALKNLNLPDISRVDRLSKGTSYVMSNGKLHLRLPQTNHPDFMMMQIINQATTLALEEKRILDEMDVVMRQNEIGTTKKPNKGVGLISSVVVVLLCLLFVRL